MNGTGFAPLQALSSISTRISVSLAAQVPAASGAAPGSSEPPKLDPMQLVLHASVPVKLVIVVLAAFSLLCWVVIFAKALHIARARSDSARFMKAFDSAGTLDALAQQGLSGFAGSPFARIFATGYDEMVRLTKGERGKRLDEAQGTHVESITRRAAAAEVTHLESWMSLLGTIGSTAPFIGLFGTVYGIMDAFLRIGQEKSASLPVVAPAIGEALIATAIGLFAAIPAVVAYNTINKRIEDLLAELETSSEGWVAIVSSAPAEPAPVLLRNPSNRPPAQQQGY